MKILSYLIRWGLKLRYHIGVEGLNEIKQALGKRPKGVVFFPNHPAEIDPVILSAFLYPRFALRPLVVEKFFASKWVRFFLKSVKAVPLTEMETGLNQWKTYEIQKRYEALKQDLQKGDNFLIYPAGHLKSGPLEEVGGASLAHRLTSDVPEMKIVLVKTSGLWGSSFSRYPTGYTPPFGPILLENLKALLKNGLFFMPRRRIRIQFFPEPKDFPRKEDRLTFNRYLETWYNKEGPEPVSIVSYGLFQKEKEVPRKEKSTLPSQEIDRKIPEEIRKEVITFLAKLSNRGEEKMTSELRLSVDLGLDSLESAELHTFLQRRFDVPPLTPSALQTVQDVLQAAAHLFSETQKLSALSMAFKKEPLKQEEKRPEIHPPEGSTLQEAFLRACKKGKSCMACVDALNGALSYKRVLLASILLSNKIKNLEGKHIGIMMPSLASTFLVVFGVLLAGKIPVMLNWTSGRRALENAKDITQFQVVLTSAKFLERLEDTDFGHLFENLLYLEDLREGISFKDNLKGFFLSCLSASYLLKHFQVKDIRTSDTAVILFTSGTEALPKAVPLSHNNILFDQRSALSCVSFLSSDRMYSMLPPFHSFGFSVTGLLPLLINMIAIYAPDPTNSLQMKEDIAFWKPTIFASAPSFIRGVFSVGSFQDFLSLRLLVSGAEKMPDELRKYVTKNLPDTLLLEGYGITECSPIVTLTRPEAIPEGVGAPLPGVDIAILDPDTLRFLPRQEEGEVCIKGANVFAGYLGIKKDPFIIHDGNKWYRAGDRGKITEKGNLVLSGRYKRFIKISGEMVSLSGLEEEVMGFLKKEKLLPENSSLPLFAIGVTPDKEGKMQITLFAIWDLSLEKINAYLREKGYGRLVKIAKLEKLEEIPVTGVGKVDYRKLEKEV